MASCTVLIIGCIIASIQTVMTQTVSPTGAAVARTTANQSASPSAVDLSTAGIPPTTTTAALKTSPTGTVIAATTAGTATTTTTTTTKQSASSSAVDLSPAGIPPTTTTAALKTSPTSTVIAATTADSSENPRTFDIAGCPDGWEEVNLPSAKRAIDRVTWHCLKLFSQPETFTGAQAQCGRLNSFLVNLNSVSFSDLSVQASIIRGPFWTGLYKVNNRFYWDGVIPTVVRRFPSMCPLRNSDIYYGWGCEGVQQEDCVSANFTVTFPEIGPSVELRSQSCILSLPYFCFAVYQKRYTFNPDPICGGSWLYDSYDYISYKYFDATYSGGFTDAYGICKTENSSLSVYKTSNNLLLLIGLLSGRAERASIGKVTFEDSSKCGVIDFTRGNASLEVAECSLQLSFICEKMCYDHVDVPSLTFAQDSGLLTCSSSRKKRQNQQFWTQNGEYIQTIFNQVQNTDGGSSSVYAATQIASFRCGVFDDEDPSRRIWSNVVLVSNLTSASVSYRAIITLNASFNESLLKYAFFPLLNPEEVSPTPIRWVIQFVNQLQMLPNASKYQLQITDIGPINASTMIIYGLLTSGEYPANPMEPDALGLAVLRTVTVTNRLSSVNATKLIFRDPFYCFPYSSYVLPNGKTASLPKTLAGETVSTGICGSTGKISCSGNFSVGAFWDNSSWHLNASSMDTDCVAGRLKIINQHGINLSNIFEVVETLANLSQSTEGFTEYTMEMMARIVSNLAAALKNIPFRRNLLKIPKRLGVIVSNAMEVQPSSILARQCQSNSSFQESLESALLWLAEVISANSSLESTIDSSDLSLSAGNVAFQVDISTKTVGFELVASETVASPQLSLLNMSAVDINGSTTRLLLTRGIANNSKAYIVYGNSHLFQPLSKKWKVMHQVFSAQLFPLPRSSQNTEEVLRITFRDIVEGNANQKFACGFWNYSSADWSFSGCSTTMKDNDTIECNCNHLTNFAVMLDTSSEPIDPEHDQALTLISYIGLGISILALAAVIISFMVCRDMRKTLSQKALFNLSLSLISLDIVFVAGINQTGSRGGCIAVAALLHYFLLTSFSWMLIEAVLQYLNLVKVFGTYIPGFLVKCSIPAWGIPAVIVAIVCGISLDLYSNSAYCFAKTVVIWYGVVTPIGAVLVVNIVIYGMVLRSVCCLRRTTQLRSNQSARRQTRLNAQAGVVICILLGLTWVFGFFQINNTGFLKLVCTYLFCIFNSIQGLLIFIFHCAREKSLNDKWRRICCRRKLPDRSMDMSLDDIWRFGSNAKTSTLNTSASSSGLYSSHDSSLNVYSAREL